MAVPKKRTSMSKKRIRKNLWKKKTYFSVVQSKDKKNKVYHFFNSSSYYPFGIFGPLLYPIQQLIHICSPLKQKNGTSGLW